MAPSSPIAFPESSPPAPAPVNANANANSKRPRSQDATKPAKPRVIAGFFDDEDSEEGEELVEPSPKRRLTHHPAANAPGFTADAEPVGEDALDRLDAAGAARVSNDGITTPASSQLDDDARPAASNHDSVLGLSHFNFASLSSLQPVNPNYRIHTCSGKSVPIRQRKAGPAISYQNIVAARSKTKEGRAVRSHFGIDIYELARTATKEIAEAKELAKGPITPPADPDRPVTSVEDHGSGAKRSKRCLMWTEKYRARNFVDLVGDDMTNRQVLHWLKRWDPIVFPHGAKKKSTAIRRPGRPQTTEDEQEKPHRKILMLTGPPGLGKTTLAHVCARKAGYEVMEINASDDRSKDVVKGRIRTSLATESVKTVEHKKPEPGKQQKVARPVCVVVDEVDGVVTGSGGSGEGGFVKALIDLVLTDQKNSSSVGQASSAPKRKKKGDDFRQMRPLILICNDIYHPSLRPLRQSGLAEVIHVGKPSLDAVVTRLKTVFEKEGIPCERDAARKLCEAAWGMGSGTDAKRGAESTAQGDLRGIMVVGEWVAGRLRATRCDATPCLTRQWVDKYVMQGLSHGGGSARGLGRGGTKEIVQRVFQEGAGFPKQTLKTATAKTTSDEQPQQQLGFAEQHKKYAMARLAEMIDTAGETERIMTEIFSEYPDREYNDDLFLTKPDTAYEWMHFHDTCSSRIFSSQEWELGAYVGQPILACHHLFASPNRHYTNANGNRKWGDELDAAGNSVFSAPKPFTGPRADFAAYEAEKVNRAALQGIQAQLPPSLSRSFRSPEDVATDFLPYLVRLVSPDVKPVVVGASDAKGASVASVRREAEKIMVKRAAEVLAEVGIALQKGRIEENPGAGPAARAQWVYRMEPDLDTLAAFETGGAYLLSSQAPTRYAVRQVLDQELQKTMALRENAARQARFKTGGAHDDDYIFDDKENRGKKTAEQQTVMSTSNARRDFFGRIIEEIPKALHERDANGERKKGSEDTGKGKGVKVWVTFHEGFSDAVRKPISLQEFLSGL